MHLLGFTESWSILFSLFKKGCSHTLSHWFSVMQQRLKWHTKVQSFKNKSVGYCPADKLHSSSNKSKAILQLPFPVTSSECTTFLATTHFLPSSFIIQVHFNTMNRKQFYKMTHSLLCLLCPAKWNLTENDQIYSHFFGGGEGVCETFWGLYSFYTALRFISKRQIDTWSVICIFLLKNRNWSLMLWYECM